MNYTIERLINEVKSLDMHKELKELLSLFLNKLASGLIDTLFLTNALSELAHMNEEVEIYEIDGSKPLRHVIHLMVKEILTFTQSRQVFYQKVMNDLKKPLISNWRPYLFIGLLEFFMCETNGNEIVNIFAEDLDEFYNFYYNAVLNDISNYLETDTFLWFHECEIWSVLGDLFSHFIKVKIQECIIRNQVEEFCKIYANFFNSLNEDDLIDIFCGEKINLIPFLLKNDSIHEYNCFESGLYFEKKNEPKVSECIGNGLYHYFMEHEVQEDYYPLFSLALFEYLTQEQLQALLNNPEAYFFPILCQYKLFLAYGSVDRFQQFLSKNDLSLKDNIIQVVRNGSLDDISVIWKYWLWDNLNINELKKILEEKNLNFIKKILKNAFHYTRDYNFYFYYFIPERIKEHLKPQMKEHIVNIIRKGEMDSFVPLLAIRLLDYFNTKELLTLVKDKDLHLLEKIEQAIENHYNKIIDLNEGFYRWKINFYKFLSKFNIPISENIDRVEPSETLVFHLSSKDKEIFPDEYEDQEEDKSAYVKIDDNKIYVRNKILDLSGLNIYSLEFVECLFELKDLRVLSLSNNFFTELPTKIGNLKSLEDLIIEKCDLGNIPESIGDLIRLRHLNLHRTNLEKLPNTLGNLSNLESLNISFNGIVEFPVSFRNLKNLKELNVRNNIFEEIPSWISNLKNLEVLNLAGNRKLKKLPDSLSKLKWLEELSLFSTGISTLPSSIGDLKLLRKIDISSTLIEELPETIGELLFLEELYFSPNPVYRVTPKIPPSILKCKSLRYLEINKTTYNDHLEIMKKLEDRGVSVYH